jgi:hypothetical protein
MYVCFQDSSYTHSKQYTYREQGVKVSRSAQLGEGVVLGQGTVVHDDAILRRAIVGRGLYVRVRPFIRKVNFDSLIAT